MQLRVATHFQQAADPPLRHIELKPDINDEDDNACNLGGGGWTGQTAATWSSLEQTAAAWRRHQQPEAGSSSLASRQQQPGCRFLYGVWKSWWRRHRYQSLPRPIRLPCQISCHAQSLAKPILSCQANSLLPSQFFLAKPILSCQANSLLLSKFSLVKPILLPSGYAGIWYLILSINW